MENQKVYFPCYGRCEFSNLQDAADYVKNILATAKKDKRQFLFFK